MIFGVSFNFGTVTAYSDFSTQIENSADNLLIAVFDCI